MSSYVLSSRTNNNVTSQEETTEPEDLLNQGIEKIYHSFTINNKKYKEKINENENIINGLTKKLEMLKNEIEMLKRENQYYKTQNEKLKKEVEKLNRIVKNIQGRLSSVDFQINECIKGDNINKNHDNNNKKIKNSSLNINYKQRDNSQSLFQLKAKRFLMEEKENNINYNNKSTKNKKLVYFIDNNLLQDNGYINNHEKHEKDTFKENFKNTDYGLPDEIKKKFNKTVGYNSFDLNVNIKSNTNNNINTKSKKNEVLKTPNSVLYKNIILKEDKKKKNNIRDTDSEKGRDASLSYQENNKNRSYSSKQFVKEKKNKKNLNNKTTDEIGNNVINNEILNMDNDSSHNKGFEGKICLTYDNKFNQNNSKRKKTYNSFRGKILNKYISENILKNDSHQKDKYEYDFNDKKTKNDEITFFLRKCKMILDKDSFEEIVKLFQDYKDGLLTDEGIITKTQRYLKSNEDLVDLFNKFFSK